LLFSSPGIGELFVLSHLLRDEKIAYRIDTNAQNAVNQNEKGEI